MNTFIEYMKIHLISLNQDLDPLDKTESELIHIIGQIDATRHLLSVATDMIES
jgi:hypothetical protein